jgi:hypothetical protein
MYWWDNLPEERYWMEITDRWDIGSDLHCPQSNEAGRGYWSYSLINEILPGDVVFHYSTNNQTIVGASVAGAPLEERVTNWEPHGTVGGARVEHRLRPGWWRPLYSYSQAATPITLSKIVASDDKNWVINWIGEKEASNIFRRKNGESNLKDRTFAPFQRYGGDGLRAQQGYLAKMPAEFINHWTQLKEQVDALSDTQERLAQLAEIPLIVEPLLVDDDSGEFVPKSSDDYSAEVQAGIQRRTRKHEALVAQAADFLEKNGANVSNPHPIDLLVTSPTVVIFEAKIVHSGALYAIRHAVGQLHEYRYFLGYRNASLCILLDKQVDDLLVKYVEKELDLKILWQSGGTFHAGPVTMSNFRAIGIPFLE